jgi:hypothetical protein|tara:strand:- start:1356 stop:2000 length:645 start_codon:yes stop_codon:yes gene_type:complete
MSEDLSETELSRGAQLAHNSVAASQHLKDLENSMQLVKVLTEHEDLLETFRREMKGERLIEADDGERFWAQVEKPMFVQMDKNDEPLMRHNKKTKRDEYITNEIAVTEIVNILKSCGLNQISPLTNIDEEEIRADLLEMESKIAMLLAVKRKKWGIDRALYPSMVGNLKMLIKDARYRAKDGTVLKALRTITQRIEQTKGDTLRKSSPQGRYFQ